MKTAIFPGTFDPFTRGHQAVVKEALDLFDHLVIAIGDNCSKHTLLSAENRLRLIQDLYADEPRVECVTYDTLTGELARERGAVAIVRGVRNTVDFEYERTMAQINRRIFPEITTVVLFTPPDLTDIASSTVRELLAFGHDVSGMVPEGIDIDRYLH
ncbi:MAG: pantetheine-phosphate adenylyltransferase [Alistipes sp.]|nr:pantetheine-phosphate adenylyltransferase [Alistipes sp.]